MFIPSREDTTNAAVNLIRDWLSHSHGNHIVHLRYRADLGYENLFVRFSLEFNMKVSLLLFAVLICTYAILLAACYHYVGQWQLSNTSPSCPTGETYSSISIFDS